MDKTGYLRLGEIFAQACCLDGDEQSRYLAEACGADQELLEAAQRLLQADREVGEEDSLDPAELRVEIPSLGGYRIVRCIGEGGMGVVYEAEQQSPRRRVALKVIRHGFETPALRQRFEREAELLGRLQHPGIAAIHEAGTAETGTPFFAMEFVEGRSLVEHVQGQSIDRRGILQLFARVCDAVQHAHAQGIVHRDLKPGNILVDAHGQPKILDFGVARLADVDLDAHQTRTGQIVGTPAYMSPEQAAGDPGQVDTRADVYSLGVILYELLAGNLPYDLANKPLTEAARIVRDQEPSRLGNFDRSLRGDLKTIVDKALQKERERRYQTAAEFAADARRFLQHEPIVARPPTTLYQLSKFARRHKPLVAAASVVLAALVFTAVASSLALREVTEAKGELEIQLGVTQTARDEAERESDLRAAILEFVRHDLLESIDPHFGGKDMTVRQALDRASERLELRLDDHPEVTAGIHHTLGSSYLSIGELDLARPHLEKSLALRRRELGDEDPSTLDAITTLVLLSSRLGRDLEAMALAEEELEARSRLFDAADSLTLAARGRLATLYAQNGRFDEGERILREQLEAYSNAAPGEEPNAHELLRTRRLLALVDLYRGRLDRAEAAIVELAESTVAYAGADHPDTLEMRSQLGHLRFEQGRLEDAHKIFEDVLERQFRVLGEAHPATLTSMQFLADTCLELGDIEAALDLTNRALEIRLRAFGEQNPGTIVSLNQLGLIHVRQGRPAQALPLYQRALQASEALGALHSSNHLAILGNLGKCHDLLGQPTEARHFLERALSGCTEVYGAEGSPAIEAAHHLGNLLVKQGAMEEALCVLAPAAAAVQENAHPFGHAVFRDLATAQRVLGQLEQSESNYRAALQALPESHANFEAPIRMELGIVLNKMGRGAQAQTNFARGVEIYREWQGEDSPDTLRATEELARLCMSRGSYPLARDCYQRILDSFDSDQRFAEPRSRSIAYLLAVILVQLGQAEEAEQLCRQLLEPGGLSLASIPHPLEVRQYLAASLAWLRDPQAEAYSQKLLADCRQHLGAEAPITIAAAEGLAFLYADSGRADQAEPLLVEALSTRMRVGGELAMGTPASRSNLGGVLLTQGRLEEAYELLQQATLQLAEQLGEEHPNVQIARGRLAGVLDRQGSHAEARLQFEAALSTLREYLPEHFHVGVLLQGLGHCLLELDELEAAEESLLEAEELLANARGGDHPRTVECRRDLARLYHKRQEPEEAEFWEEQLANSGSE